MTAPGRAQGGAAFSAALRRVSRIRVAGVGVSLGLALLGGCHNPNIAEGGAASASPVSSAASGEKTTASASMPADDHAAQNAAAISASAVPDAPGSPASASTSTGSPAPPLTSAGRAPRPAFDGDAAFRLLARQCEFGTRELGSKAHERAKEYLLQEMKRYADVTTTQTFDYRGLPVTNVIGIFHAKGASAPSAHPVLLLTHWDSRPIADGPYSSEVGKNPPFRYDGKAWNRATPIMAANDGASGTAVLLQLARMFKQNPPPVGVVMLLDDGEDYGAFHATHERGEGIELGSRYFAAHYRSDGRLGRPDYGILLDMVGGKDLVLPMETNSMRYAPGTLTKVYQAGQALGYKNTFRGDLTFNVNDDHIALNEVGLHVIDLVPYFGDSAPAGVTGYTYWHTLEDTQDKCSAASLKIVGDTLAEVIYNEPPSP